MHNSQQTHGLPQSLAAATPFFKNMVSSAYKESKKKQHGWRHIWRTPELIYSTAEYGVSPGWLSPGREDNQQRV